MIEAKDFPIKRIVKYIIRVIFICSAVFTLGMYGCWAYNDIQLSKLNGFWGLTEFGMELNPFPVLCSDFWRTQYNITQFPGVALATELSVYTMYEQASEEDRAEVADNLGHQLFHGFEELLKADPNNLIMLPVAKHPIELAQAIASRSILTDTDVQEFVLDLRLNVQNMTTEEFYDELCIFYGVEFDKEANDKAVARYDKLTTYLVILNCIFWLGVFLYSMCFIIKGIIKIRAGAKSGKVNRSKS